LILAGCRVLQDGHRKTGVARRLVRGILLLAIVSQLICNILYLFFPLYIHDSFRIVVKAFAQQVDKSSLEFCPRRETRGYGND
jgi:hypothetical protein